nr:hypothetical protein [Ardenticatena sp.]
MALLLSMVDVLLSMLFAGLVLRQWMERRKPHQLLWAMALLIWTIAVSAEVMTTIAGVWTPFTYRLYYAFGALMVAAWLGAGSVFLVASRRVAWSFLILIVLLSLTGSSLIFTYPIDASLLTHTDTLGFVETNVFPFIPVRIFIVISNILGTVAFVGSALYSLWSLRHSAFGRSRSLGVGLIAVGGLVAASTHSIGVLGGPGLFRLSELVAIVFIFGGYLISNLSLDRQVVFTPQTS